MILSATAVSGRLPLWGFVAAGEEYLRDPARMVGRTEASG